MPTQAEMAKVPGYGPADEKSAALVIVAQRAPDERREEGIGVDRRGTEDRGDAPAHVERQEPHHRDRREDQQSL
jgi:hypothetical protein